MEIHTVNTYKKIQYYFQKKGQKNIEKNVKSCKYMFSQIITIKKYIEKHIKTAKYIAKGRF